MKNKRRLFCLIFSVLLLFSMSALTVYAHPGRLDSNGRHNDYVSGGYHYHTGTGDYYQYDPLDNSISIAQQEIILLFISAPVVFLLFYVLIKLRGVPKSHASSSKTESPVSHSTSSDPEPETPFEFKLCHTIWLCTYHISRHCGFSHRSFSQGRIWATLLYIAAKHIRDQAVVDQIYSYFESASLDVGEDNPYPPSILSLVRHGYSQFAPILNASGIDPRTPDGIQALWELIKKEDFKNTDPHPSAARAYFDYTQILISNLTTYHKSDQ